MINGLSVHESRLNAGRILAQEKPVDADLVIGVPDSGLDAALGYSMSSGIPYDIGLIKNKYIGRTFIDPGDRLDKVKIKLSVVEGVVKDKKIILIDDSIVRGTTSRRIISLLREAGAKEVHMRVCAPPFLYPCFYGTDIDSSENLVACQHTVPEISEMIGADSLAFFPVGKLELLAGGHNYCSACFDGRYPTGIPVNTGKNRFEQRLLESGKS